jgi:hypothetical protein
VKTVWKYAIDPAAGPTGWFNIPKGARFLHCADQYGQVALWFEVPPVGGPFDSRQFRLVGTGFAEVDAEFTYLGTVLLQGGQLVLHVYEVLT